MKVGENQVKYLADIAMIAMDDEETEAQRRDLERIATYTETLAGIDTVGVPEQTHPFGHDMEDGSGEANDSCGAGEAGVAAGVRAAGKTGAMSRFREDEVTNEDRTKEFMAAAPDSKGPYFRVPRTIEE